METVHQATDMPSFSPVLPLRVVCGCSRGGRPLRDEDLWADPAFLLFLPGGVFLLELGLDELLDGVEADVEDFAWLLAALLEGLVLLLLDWLDLELLQHKRYKVQA